MLSVSVVLFVMGVFVGLVMSIIDGAQSSQAREYFHLPIRGMLFGVDGAGVILLVPVGGGG